jgi:gas vesicle protein
MAERTDELRQDIDRKRDEIGYTVDQIQNRVSPRRVTARGTHRLRRWWIDARDQLMGNDQTQYPWESASQRIGDTSQRIGEKVGEITDRTAEKLSDMREGIADAPQMVRQQTQGNPLAAGLITFGGGLLVGTLLPRTDVERQAAQRVQPAVSEVAQEAADVGKEIADEVRSNASEAMEEVKDTATNAVEGVKGDAKGALDRVRDDQQSDNQS